MRIQFERSGGFAGMRITATIDTDSLSPDDAKSLREMVDASDFFNLPSTIRSPSSTADSFQYKVIIEDQGRKHMVEAGDQAVPPTLKPLLRRLEILARSSHR